MSFTDVIDNYLWLSHDPQDFIETRWGLRRCDMIRARINDTLKAQDFVVQQYSATDPVYVERRRNMNLSELRQLQKDGQRFGCNKLPPLPRQVIFPPP